MAPNYEQEYRALQASRREYNKDSLNGKKLAAWEYFRKLTRVQNLEKRLQQTPPIYLAPVKRIHGSRMVNWPTKTGEEIYIDNEFAQQPENAGVVSHQLTHELLHSLSKNDTENQFFGHDIKDFPEITGINEAATQLFTDDIQGKVLSEEVDYLYFVKGSLRTMATIIGKDKLASQYLNNDNPADKSSDKSFEEAFDKLTNNRFRDFASTINTIYKLEKNREKLSEPEKKLLETRKKQIVSFISAQIEKASKTDPTLQQRLLSEFGQDGFLAQNHISDNFIREQSSLDYGGQIKNTLSNSNITLSEVNNLTHSMQRHIRQNSIGDNYQGR